MKKYLLGIFAIVLAVGFSAFTTIKSETAARAQAQLYWYQVDEQSQVILEDTPLFDHAERASLTHTCADEGDLDCLRGFEFPQDTEEGPIFDIGEDQIKTEE